MYLIGNLSFYVPSMAIMCVCVQCSVNPPGDYGWQGFLFFNSSGLPTVIDYSHWQTHFQNAYQNCMCYWCVVTYGPFLFVFFDSLYLFLLFVFHLLISLPLKERDRERGGVGIIMPGVLSYYFSLVSLSSSCLFLISQSANSLVIVFLIISFF